MVKWWIIAVSVVVLGFVVSCAGQPPDVPEEPIFLEEPSEDPEQDPVEVQPPEPIAEPAPEADSAVDPDLDDEIEAPSDDTITEPEDAEREPETISGGNDAPFVVTEEVYVKTFEEVEKTIGILNEIIRDRDFEHWKRYLTQTYIDEFSDPETLRARSQSPILQRNNIVLRSLEDYFNWVVAPSRANARLDDLEFVNDDTVIAIMVVQGQPVILYQLKNTDGIWKIDLF
ncbi:MAG: hypothetical protein EA426_08875 [Spirochaetaceae bacterium]|nr:MAG: hypothetical protein EA426_08875 [Spirochaetaceae bacterium]